MLLDFYPLFHRSETLFLLPEIPRNAVFLKKHLVQVPNILCANWFCDVQSPYQVPINTLLTPTVVGVGREMVGFWQVQSTGLTPGEVLFRGLPHVSVLCAVRFNYLFFSIVAGIRSLALPTQSLIIRHPNTIVLGPNLPNDCICFQQ